MFSAIFYWPPTICQASARHLEYGHEPSKTGSFLCGICNLGGRELSLVPWIMKKKKKKKVTVLNNIVRAAERKWTNFRMFGRHSQTFYWYNKITSLACYPKGRQMPSLWRKWDVLRKTLLCNQCDNVTSTLNSNLE